MPEMAVPEPALSPAWPWLPRLVKLAAAVVVLSWAVMVIAWLTLHWLILPHIDYWRPALQRHASEAIGRKLSIGAVRVQPGGWLPTLDLRDVRLFDAQQREALLLQQVQIAVSLRSLLAARLRFEQVLIEGARVEVKRDAAGHWNVAGIDLHGSPEEAGESGVREWLFEQPELILRQGTLTWRDELAGKSPLEMQQIELVLRNRGRRHALLLEATPPSALGQRFSLRARFTRPLLSEAAQMRRWSGTAYAELPLIELRRLREHFELPFELSDGAGALRAWVEVAAGVPNRATLDIALRDVSMRLAPTLRALAFDRVQGRLDTTRDATGVRLGTQGLAFQTAEGVDWPASRIDLAWQQAQDLGSLQPSRAPVKGGAFSADRLDLGVLAHAAMGLPLGAALRTGLQQLAPRGIIEELKGDWQGPLDAPDRYQLSAQVNGLALQAAPAQGGGPAALGRPGLRNASLRVDASERGGSGRLKLERGALVLPGVFDEPELALQRLDAQLAWRVTPRPGGMPQLEIKVAQASFANADLKGEATATWHTGAETASRLPGHLDLNGRLQQVRAESVARYLPLVLPEGVRDYVRRGVRGGSVSSANFRVRGALRDFPFRHSQQGEFGVQLRVQDLVYAFQPGSAWPVLEQVNGELAFERQALRLNGLQGRLWGYQLRDVKGGIADLAAADAMLTLEGQGAGPAAALLRLVREAPLHADLGPSLESISASTDTTLTLALGIALAGPAQTTVRGGLQLGGGELQLHPGLPPLRNVRGSIDFTRDSFVLRNASARLLDGEVAFDGGLAAGGALRIGARGSTNVDALRALPQWADAASLLRGQAAWRAAWVHAQGKREFTLSSELVGLQIDLPTPADKPAAAAWPLRLSHVTQPGGVLDDLSLDLGEVFKLRLQRDLSGAQPRVVKGSMAVLDTLPPPSPRLSASLRLGRVDLDAWQAVLDRFGAQGGGGAGHGYLPRDVKLRAEALRVQGHSLTDVSATLRHERPAQSSVWHAAVSSDQLLGEVEYRAAADDAHGGKLKARLQRLSLPRSDMASVEQALSQPPTEVPALDIVIDDFELRGHKLGRLQVDAVNRPQAGRVGPRGPVEWQLDKLSLDNAAARLDASGRWSATGTRRMALEFKLALADSGALIERLGRGDALRGGEGQLQGRLSWEGSPLALDLATLDGEFDLAVEHGRFVRAEPGAARLLGVLSLQSLSRRLNNLDFRDLFEAGFAFDRVEGKVRVAQGVARTDELSMSSVQATVLMQGSTDLLHETQDMQVMVIPNFDASGAALATMAINPAIGLGALVAQWALREPLRAAGTRVFHVTGSWAEPKVAPVERALGAPLPVIETLASPPPSAASATEASARP